ncbi:MAG: hypothetical protein IBX40_02190 [Methanosarcinales archaeon]|nr:hypothetical protein [Methanosarcinales archaeon]
MGTRALVRSFPMMERTKDLAGVRGSPPSKMSHSMSGCIFGQRCTQSTDICSHKQPPVNSKGEGLKVISQRLKADRSWSVINNVKV